MRKLAILHRDEVEPQSTYPVPTVVTGLAWSKLLSPRDYVLWLCLSEIEAGGQLTWPAEHSDEALYVFSGELAIDGHTCPERGAVIIESDVPTTVTAQKRSRIAHWGSWDTELPQDCINGAPRRTGHCVHVIGPEGIFRSGDPAQVGVRAFADSLCDTCRISLFEVTREKPRPGRPHSHSADEIIFVVSGSIELGALKLAPGTGLSIPGGVRYAEGAGPDGAVFINYRRTLSDRTNFFKDQPPTKEMETLGLRAGLRRTDDVVNVMV